MASRKHLVAVNRTIRAGGLDETGLDAAVVEFARDLARRMDSYPLEDVPLNLVRAYQSALKDVQRAHGGFSASRRRRDEDEEPDSMDEVTASEPAESEEGALAKLRREKAERKKVREDRAEDLHEASEGADSGD